MSHRGQLHRQRCAGKTLKAIKAYRAINGVSLDEARAAIRNL
ncbi:MAG TPA: hypothetical protein VGG43_13455 [Acidimicrobiales bacterium]|jgi:ribosomal protein L7/L12